MAVRPTDRGHVPVLLRIWRDDGCPNQRGVVCPCDAPAQDPVGPAQFRHRRGLLRPGGPVVGENLSGGHIPACLDRLGIRRQQQLVHLRHPAVLSRYLAGGEGLPVGWDDACPDHGSAGRCLRGIGRHQRSLLVQYDGSLSLWHGGVPAERPPGLAGESPVLVDAGPGGPAPGFDLHAS